MEHLICPVVCPLPVLAGELPPYPYVVPLERADYFSGRLPNLDDLGHVDLRDHLSVSECHVLLVPVHAIYLLDRRRCNVLRVAERERVRSDGEAPDRLVGEPLESMRIELEIEVFVTSQWNEQPSLH